VTRQLTLEQGSDAAEAARLTRLLGMQGSLGELNARSPIASPRARPICRRRAVEHLWQTTMDKLAVDQPNYASYKGSWAKELARPSTSLRAA
jgi:hypothetical protein